MNNKLCKISPRGGMTLIEVVAAMAIIAVCSAMLLAGYRATLGVMRHSVDSASRANAAFADSQRGAAAERGEISFWSGGSKYTVSGSFSHGGEQFYCFTPDRGAR